MLLVMYMISVSFEKQRGYLTTSGMPVKNSQLVGELMDAIQLPTEVAVIKVKAHTGDKTTEAKGNTLADEAAKAATKPEATRLKHTNNDKCDKGQKVNLRNE